MECPIARFDRDGIRNTLREVLGRTRLPFGCADGCGDARSKLRSSKFHRKFHKHCSMLETFFNSLLAHGSLQTLQPTCQLLKPLKPSTKKNTVYILPNYWQKYTFNII